MDPPRECLPRASKRTRSTHTDSGRPAKALKPERENFDPQANTIRIGSRRILPDPASALFCSEQVEEVDLFTSEIESREVEETLSDGSCLLTLPSCLLHSGCPGLSHLDTETLEVMTEKSAKYTVDPDYLKSRPFIDSQKRSVLLDWMLEVAHAFQVGRDTYHMAANYVDRYLANSWGIRPESLQLLAITCLFIAAKIEEVNPPQAILYAEATDNTFCAQDIVDFEGQILDTLQWNLLPDTVIAWVKYYTARSVSLIQSKLSETQNYGSSHCLLQILDEVLNIDNFARIMEIIDFALLHPSFLEYPRSHIAASAFLKVQPLNDHVVEITGFCLEDLCICDDWLSQFTRIPIQGLASIDPGSLNNSGETPDLVLRQVHHPEALQMISDALM